MTSAEKYILTQGLIKDLSERSNCKGLWQLCCHLGLLSLACLMMFLTQSGFWFYLFLFINGLLITFLFSPLHESIHFTAFKSRWLNNLTAASCGFILLIPFRYFRIFHYAHHRHTQNPKLDPELIGKKTFGQLSYILYISGLPFWFSNIKLILQHCAGQVQSPFIGAHQYSMIIREARIHLLTYITLFGLCLFFANAVLWYYWVLPALLTQPFLRWFLLAEHTGCDFCDQMLENSRTTYTSKVMYFVSWNMPYHAEHHYLASIPFHALPALHTHTKSTLKFTAQGYYRANLEFLKFR